MNSATHQLVGYSIEATAKDARAIGRLPEGMPRPAQVFVPFLPDEDDAARVAACAAIRAAGLEPVPHVSARRLSSAGEFDAFLGALREEAGVEALFLIAGDLSRPAGPFADSLAVIRSGLIEARGFRHVGIAGHPDGHPDVPEAVLWQAMAEKLAALAELGLETQIVTQFSFDAARVLAWLAQLRGRGMAAPVRIGIPGPANVHTLLRYAVRCGVSASASVVAKYGLSLTRLLGTAGPDAFLAELGAGLAAAELGQVRVHIFPFGGFAKVAGWMEEYEAVSRVG